MPCNSSIYTILKDSDGDPIVLEEDGWGSVYKAFHDALRCHVALRVIPHSAFAGDEVREQFVKEVAIASQIRHRCLAAVLPLATAEGSFFYARELVDGEKLQAFLRINGPLSKAQALTVLNQLAGSLETAFTKGLLHHNICDETVRLFVDDEAVNVKLVDLGLPAGRFSTSFAGSAGKSEFETPDEAVGMAVDVHSSIYSLGVLLCYMLLGPDRCSSLFTKPPRDGIDLHPGALSDLSAETIVVLNSALKTNPKLRFGSFGALRTGLGGALSVETSRVIGSARGFRRIPQDASALAPASAVKVLSEEERNRSETGSPSPRKLLTIPAAYLSLSQAGVALTLRSVDDESLPGLVVTARDCVKMGRAHGNAGDLVTRFLPRSQANDHKTRRLSKVQAMAKCERDKVELIDGDGHTASANGSKFAETILSTKTPLVLDKPGELLLANDYSIRVFPSTSTDEDELVIGNVDQWGGPASHSQHLPKGFVLLMPNHPPKSPLVWLFSTAKFGSSDAAAINFELPPGEEVLGAFHNYRGCFWLESKSTGNILINDQVLGPGGIVPLISGQGLRIKNSVYRVEVEV